MIRPGVLVCALFLVASPITLAQEKSCKTRDCRQMLLCGSVISPLPAAPTQEKSCEATACQEKPEAPAETIEEESAAAEPEPKSLNGSFSVGAGFSSDEGFIATSKIQKRNLLGTGYQLSLNASLSSRRQEVLAQLKMPHIGENDATVTIDAGVTERVFQNGLTQSWAGGSVSWKRELADHWSLSLRGTIADTKATAPAPFFPKDLLGGGTSVVGSIGLVYKAQDDPERPRSEFMHSLRADISQNLQQGGGFFRIEKDVAYAFSLRENKKLDEGATLRFGLSLGYVSSLTENGQVPVTERFFVGGENSVRGFSPGVLGPELNLLSGPGEAFSPISVGGTGKAVFRSELSFPVVKKAGLHGLVFFDAGNAFGGISGKNAGLFTPQETDFGVFPLRTAAGVGLRWESPIGPLNLTLGVPLDRRPGEAPVLLQFSIGRGL